MPRQFEAHPSSFGVTESISGIEPLLHAHEVQQQRNAKMAKVLIRQAEQEQASKVAWQEKQTKKQVRQSQLEAEQEEGRRAKANQSKVLARQRRDRLEVAAIIEEGAREAARSKVEAGSQRMNDFEREQAAIQRHNEARSQHVAARRSQAYRQSQALDIQRRQQIVQRQQMAENLLRQKEELRQLQLQIKAEEEFFKEMRRAEVKNKAVAEHAARVTQFEVRSAQKNSSLRRQMAEAEEHRRLRAEEARYRSEYIRMHAAEAAERDEAERSRLREKLAEKAARADALANQRRSLSDAMNRMRQDMMLQESAVRSSLNRLRQSGASAALPRELMSSLDGVGGGFRLVSMQTQTNSRQPAHRGQAHRPMVHQEDSGYPLDLNGDHDMRQQQERRPYSAAAGSRRYQAQGGDFHWDPATDPEPQKRYTTAGPIAKSPARKKEEELREVLQDEIGKETERQIALTKVVEERERQRLTRIFAAEREMAKERILGLGSSMGIGVTAY